jgi:hypothetical protein
VADRDSSVVGISESGDNWAKGAWESILPSHGRCRPCAPRQEGTQIAEGLVCLCLLLAVVGMQATGSSEECCRLLMRGRRSTGFESTGEGGGRVDARLHQSDRARNATRSAADLGESTWDRERYQEPAGSGDGEGEVRRGEVAVKAGAPGKERPGKLLPTPGPSWPWRFNQT